jgi:4-carboxymuconolactone decarboxylase
MTSFHLDTAHRSPARTNAPEFAPLEPPFAPDVNEVLTKWMPLGLNIQPFALFRLLVGHPDLASRIRPMASGLIAKGLLPERDRELLISRVTARLGAEYEWGIHCVVYARRAGLSSAQLYATVHGAYDDPAFSSADYPEAALLVRAADELMADSRLERATRAALLAIRSSAQVIELHVLCGWYRTVATLILSAELGLEVWAARFRRLSSEVGSAWVEILCLPCRNRGFWFDA